MQTKQPNNKNNSQNRNRNSNRNNSNNNTNVTNANDTNTNQRNNQSKKNNNNKISSNNNILFNTSDNTKQERNRIREFSKGTMVELKKPKIPEGLVSGISNELIEDPLNVFYDSNSHGMISFEETIKIIKSREGLTDKDNLVYLGKGVFGVIDYQQEGGKKKMIIKQKFDYDYHVEEKDYRDDLRYGLPVPYEPNPDLLSDLYTDEEIANFPLNTKEKK